MENKEFSRICSMCKRKMIFKLRKSYTNSLWKIPSNKNYKCRSCSEKGRIVTPEQRIQISNSLKGRVSWNNRIAETFENTGIMYEYKRSCPKCKKDIIYTNKRKCIAKYLCKQGIKNNTQCKQCATTGQIISTETREKLSKLLKGKVPWIKGKHHSNITKRKISELVKGKLRSEETKLKMSVEITKAMHRSDIRKRHIEALSETKWLGKSVDKGQIELLNRWNMIGFKFIPNYQLHTDDFLCYIDGYDKEHNVVLEYDSKYHKKLCQKQKDLVRQNKIIDILHPKKFWRYDAINKQFTNILEGSS